MFDYLVKIARDRDIRWFIAYVLPRNEAMMKVFERSGLEISRSFEGGALTFRFDLAQKENNALVPG